MLNNLIILKVKKGQKMYFNHTLTNGKSQEKGWWHSIGDMVNGQKEGELKTEKGWQLTTDF